MGMARTLGTIRASVAAHARSLVADEESLSPAPLARFDLPEVSADTRRHLPAMAAAALAVTAVAEVAEPSA